MNNSVSELLEKTIYNHDCVRLIILSCATTLHQAQNLPVMLGTKICGHDTYQVLQALNDAATETIPTAIVSSETNNDSRWVDSLSVAGHIKDELFNLYETPEDLIEAGIEGISENINGVGKATASKILNEMNQWV